MIGLGLYHQLSLGAGGLPPAALAYFIRTLFSVVAGQPVNLTDLQVLDTDAEGLVDGSMTVYEGAAGAGNSVAITGDACVLTGGAVPTTDLAGLTTAIGVAVADGQVFYAKATPLDNTSNTVPLMLLDSNTHNYGSATGFRVGGFLFEANGNIFVYWGAAATQVINVGTYTAVEHEFAAVVDSGRISYFIKGGIWTTWTRVFVDTSQAVDPLFATFNGYSGALTLSEFKAPEDLYADLTLPIFHDSFTTPATGSIDGRTPDVVDNGLTWKVQVTADTISVLDGYAYNSVAAASTNSALIDAGVEDVVIVFVGAGQTATNIDEGCYARATYTDEVNVPDDYVGLFIEHDTNLLKITEKVGAAVVTTSVAYNPPEATPQTYVFSVIGATAKAVTETGVQIPAGNPVALTLTTPNTECGILARRDVTGTHQSRTYDFAVYNASGVTIDV